MFPVDRDWIPVIVSLDPTQRVGGLAEPKLIADALDLAAQVMKCVPCSATDVDEILRRKEQAECLEATAYGLRLEYSRVVAQANWRRWQRERFRFHDHDHDLLHPTPEDLDDPDAPHPDPCA